MACLPFFCWKIATASADPEGQQHARLDRKACVDQALKSVCIAPIEKHQEYRLDLMYRG